MKRARGFTLVEILVALVVFATMAALAYGGLQSVARTRGELARQEDAFRDLVRTIDLLNRDLGETVARPVRGASGQTLAAFIGAPDHIELTRLGFANPQAEQRSNLERVMYELDDQSLKRGRFAVLDRASDTQPQINDTHVTLDELRFRYLNHSGQWSEVWPTPQSTEVLPRAVQWNLRSKVYGELENVVEIVAVPIPTATSPAP
ncbi:MAG TPA: type II secretion system minor pseudopilin GspJ [Rudaea sp.]|jgi:general secretion pathway protein J|nr:type II secretion system minor pseudopilin GspJ [Rudaea sp.]